MYVAQDKEGSISSYSKGDASQRYFKHKSQLSIDKLRTELNAVQPVPK